MIDGSRATVALVLATLLEAPLLSAAAQTITPQTPSEPRRVVLVYDERTELPGLAILDATLVQSLTTGPAGAVEVYREAMDLSRFGSATHLPLLRDYLRAKYAAKKIDVVIAAMGPSLDFLLRPGEAVFPGVPIVFCGIDRRELAGRPLPANVTGVLVKREFSPTLEIALRLHPGTTRVVMVAGTSEFDSRLVEQARGEFRRYEDRLAFTYLTTRSLGDLLAELANLPPHTLVLYSTMFRDGAGEPFVPHEAAERITAVSKAPVYGFLDQYLGRGIVGGQLYSLEAHGKQAADLARQVMAGKPPSELPLVEGGAAVNRFDWRQMQRWGISESQLPSGSTVLYRQLTAWNLYRNVILGAAFLVVLQAALIGGLLVQRRRRRQSEGRNRAILRAMPDLMFLQTTDGVYLDYHASDQDGLLLQPEQFIGRNMRDVLPPELLRTIEPAFAQAAGSTEPVVVEYDLNMPDGVRRFEARLLSQDGRILTLVRDITERQRAADALFESQERYALATAAGAVGVWDWNFETNELFVDSRLKSILGYEDGEISNHPDDWASRVHPQDLAAAAAGMQACMDRVTDSYEIEHRMLHKDGGVKWLLSRGAAIRAADGRMLRMVGTKVDITQRKLAEEVIRENEAVLRDSHREIQDLAGRLIASQEVERARIARDLHDDLSQQLAGLAIALSSVKRRLGVVAPDAGDVLDDVSSLQQRTVSLAESVRRLSHDLHPGVLAHAGLVATLASHCEEIQRGYGVEVTFTAEGDFESTDAGTTLCLYRVAQEALRNVILHAAASRAEVRLLRRGDLAELTIADDGRGFDIVEAGTATGLGLVSINERVRLAGGTSAIVTEVMKGTSLRVQVPTNGPGPQQLQVDARPGPAQLRMTEPVGASTPA